MSEHLPMFDEDFMQREESIIVRETEPDYSTVGLCVTCYNTGFRYEPGKGVQFRKDGDRITLLKCGCRELNI